MTRTVVKPVLTTADRGWLGSAGVERGCFVMVKSMMDEELDTTNIRLLQEPRGIGQAGTGSGSEGLSGEGGVDQG